MLLKNIWQCLRKQWKCFLAFYTPRSTTTTLFPPGNEQASLWVAFCIIEMYTNRMFGAALCFLFIARCVCSWCLPGRRHSTVNCHIIDLFMTSQAFRYHDYMAKQKTHKSRGLMTKFVLDDGYICNHILIAKN